MHTLHRYDTDFYRFYPNWQRIIKYLSHISSPSKLAKKFQIIKAKSKGTLLLVINYIFSKSSDPEPYPKRSYRVQYGRRVSGPDPQHCSKMSEREVITRRKGHGKWWRMKEWCMIVLYEWMLKIINVKKSGKIITKYVPKMGLPSGSPHALPATCP